MDTSGGTASTRVLDALRERIRRGELRSGDRVPSTREIVRDWGVAMATASKVLAALRTEGLVRPVPGVGTVVASAGDPPPPPTRRTGPPATPRPDTSGSPGSPGGSGLSTPRIVAAGIAVADAEGLPALSMRRVASELGVATMSLYRHVGDKDDLVVRMMDVAFDEWAPPAEPAPGWRAELEQVCRALWERFRRHPWLASALSLTRPQALAGGMVYSDRMLAGLGTLGLGPTAAFDTQMILFNFVRGLAVSLESERQAEADTGRTADEWVDEHEADTHAALATRDLPTLRGVLDRLETGGYDLDLDRLFAAGLAHLLDGLAVRYG